MVADLVYARLPTLRPRPQGCGISSWLSAMPAAILPLWDRARPCRLAVAGIAATCLTMRLATERRIVANTADAPRLSTAQRQKALLLVEQALESSRETGFPTSRLVEDAARVARLIGDYISLTWLELELRPIDSAGQRLDVNWELRLARARIGPRRSGGLHSSTISRSGPFQVTSQAGLRARPESTDRQRQSWRPRFGTLTRCSAC